MTVEYSYDPITKKTVSRVIQWERDPTTKQIFIDPATKSAKEAASFSNPLSDPSKTVDLTKSSLAPIKQVGSSMNNVPWETTQQNMLDKSEYYKHLLGTPGQENMVYENKSTGKMYIAPLVEDSLAHGVRRGDLTKAVEVPYDAGLGNAYAMQRKYSKYGIGFDDVATLDSGKKEELDKAIKTYQDQYYRNVVLPQRRAETAARVESGEWDYVYRNGKVVGIQDNPEYFKAKSAYDMAQRGLISIDINGKPTVFTPQQLSEINVTIGEIQAKQDYNRQVDAYNASLPAGSPNRVQKVGVPDGSIYQDLGVTQKPIGKVIQDLPATQRKQVESSLRDAYDKLGRPEVSFTVFKNKYFRDPNQYVQDTFQKYVAGYDRVVSDYNIKLQAYEDAHAKYIADPTTINLARLQKAERDAKTQAEQLDHLQTTVMQDRIDTLSSLMYGRRQPYQRIKKAKPLSTKKKKTSTPKKRKPTPTPKKKPAKKTPRGSQTSKPKNRLQKPTHTETRIKSFSERFKEKSKIFMG